ncbi:hypothetical protein CSKR_200809 [Clonorchis sinensis]|uniref:Uncharacterized protein n=1 Tax=Clonorchis sinensis TaxID=79923 RepID=A0A8T1MHV7_CLOSI|nr:hypothetical protein CSKR_200809 [Clonorchis sinensis]
MAVRHRKNAAAERLSFSSLVQAVDLDRFFMGYRWYWTGRLEVQFSVHGRRTFARCVFVESFITRFSPVRVGFRDANFFICFVARLTSEFVFFEVVDFRLLFDCVHFVGFTFSVTGLDDWTACCVWPVSHAIVVWWTTWPFESTMLDSRDDSSG